MIDRHILKLGIPIIRYNFQYTINLKIAFLSNMQCLLFKSNECEIHNK